jgi:putative addiction module component (TIGR02574 family)
VVNYLRNLPLAERLELVQTLWDSIAAEQRDPELSTADRQQINKRMEAFLADCDPGLDAESIIDTIEQLL